MEMQRKLLATETSQVKFANDNPREFSGYASSFGGVDTYGDTIAPGAFRATLEDRQRPVKMRWNHGEVVGKWTSIAEDELGLRVRGELTPGHTVASNVAALLGHGAVDGLSIGFYIRASEQTEEARLITDIELIEISVVEEPADLGAKIEGIKSAIADAGSLKELENLLRAESVLSRSNVTAIVSRIKRLARRDDDQDRGERETASTVTDRLNALTKQLRNYGE
jgi:HK97 family phage prohead protease